jgi:hypothetical protein
MKSTLRLLSVGCIGLILSTSFAMASISFDVDPVVQTDFQIDKEAPQFLPVSDVVVNDIVVYKLDNVERMPLIKLVSNKSLSKAALLSPEVGWRIAA